MGPILVDAAIRKGFLEYRSLLRTNFVESSLDERLFQLAVEVLLARIQNRNLSPRQGDHGWRVANVVQGRPGILPLDRGIRCVHPGRLGDLGARRIR